ncbi:hypothetical protein ACIA49_07100 [Kribbella sp. NPDC051587]|uniref:hypothetical protein n=1 Tax=Kribbella sp. NPDC051587 TaxID=3364119 RepID=UPI003793CEEB
MTQLLAYTFSGLILSLVGVFVLVRFVGMRLLHAIIAGLCGYFIAKSQYDPWVQDLLTKLGGK